MKNDYKTTISIATLVSLVGWLAVTAAVLSALYFSGGRNVQMIGLIASGCMAFFGLLLVVAGQTVRAIVDIANYSSEMTYEMKKMTMTKFTEE